MFSLKGRIGRKEFLIRMVLLIIASLILNFISSWFGGNSPLAPDHGLHHGGSLAALLVLIAALGVTWCTICAAAARLRDIGGPPGGRFSYSCPFSALLSSSSSQLRAGKQ